MNETLKAAGHIGAELGAAMAEIEALREQVKVLQSDANSWQSGYDKGRIDGARHRKSEVERLREELRKIANLPMDRCSTENDYRLSGAKAMALAAISKQPEPTDTFTAVDMATAAAQGFRDGQAAVEPAQAQGEQPFTFVCLLDGRVQRQGSEAYCRQWADAWNGEPVSVEDAGCATVEPLYRRPAQTEQQPVAVPEDFQPLETIRWWISAYTNPENGPSYQGHGMMVQMLCEYEALRIMLSSRAQQRPTAYPHEAMDKLAADRYRVGAAGAGTLHGFAVRAGDGEQELYRGRKSDCEHVARKLAGAFLDGGLTALERYATPIAQPAPQPVEVVAWANPVDLEELKISRRSSARYVINSKSGAANVPLVRQSDHLAALLAATAPQPEQSGLVEAANGALGAIQDALENAYHNAYPECCGQAHLECCGSPLQAWSEADQKTMERFAPVERALRTALSATPSPAMAAKEA